MAINGPTYTQSAVDILTPMLSINQHRDAELARRGQQLYKGAGDLASGLAGLVAKNKREDIIQYKGDDHLESLKAELAECEKELTLVENQMRTIKAEDLGSLDEERLGEGNKPYEYRLDNTTPYDVDTIDIDGSRTFPLGDVNVPFASKSSVDIPVVEEKSTTVMDNIVPINHAGAALNLEYGDVSEEDMIEYGKHRYKPGAKALGGK